MSQPNEALALINLRSELQHHWELDRKTDEIDDGEAELPDLDRYNRGFIATRVRLSQAVGNLTVAHAPELVVPVTEDVVRITNDIHLARHIPKTPPLSRAENADRALEWARSANLESVVGIAGVTEDSEATAHTLAQADINAERLAVVAVWDRSPEATERTITTELGDVAVQALFYGEDMALASELESGEA